jgi:hypothetical protein
MMQRLAASRSDSWWSGCPFDSIPAATDLTVAILAGSVAHPDQVSRQACGSLLKRALGAEQLQEATDRVRELLGPFQDDSLEPLQLLEPDHALIAAFQLLMAFDRRQSNHVLRITPRNSIDLSGGVELTGLQQCKRVPRRRDGAWNISSGSAFHPDLLEPWIRSSTIGAASVVRSETVRKVATVRIPADRSCMLRMRHEYLLIRACKALGDYRHWAFGRAVDDQSTAGIDPFSPSMQRFSRLVGSATTLSSLGGVVASQTDDVVIQFRSPEAILRLGATASLPGAMQLAAVRPWGWLMFGRGEDEIGFIKSAHAIPPRWAQMTRLPLFDDVPEDIVVALSRWLGPFAGHANLDLLESLR